MKMCWLVIRCALAMVAIGAVTAGADPMTPAQATTLDYEGNVVPTNVWSENQAPTVTTNGDLLWIDFVQASPTCDAWWAFYREDFGIPFAINSDTWTVDFSMARLVPSGSWGNTGNVGPTIDIMVNGTGDNGGRIIVELGRHGYGGMGGGDFDDSSTITISDGPSFTEVQVPGLNIADMNNYRVVGTGGGNFKLYVNGLTQPVYTGTRSSAPPAMGWLFLGAQFHAASGSTDLTMLVDFVRVNGTVAFDSAPGPAILPTYATVTTIDDTYSQGWKWAPDGASVPTGTLVAGPAAPPLGLGSARLAMGDNGDEANRLVSNLFDGMPLDNITVMRYSTYNATTTAGLYLYLRVDTNNDGAMDDMLFYVPPADQIATGSWQTWDARNGLWYWLFAGGGNKTWNQIVSETPGAKLDVGSPSGSLRLCVGYGGAAGADDYVDKFVIGFANQTLTLYNFEPIISVDISAVLAAMDARTGQPEYLMEADVDQDGEITSTDLAVVLASLP